MCVVSAVGDNYRDVFPERWPSVVPYVTPLPYPAVNPLPSVTKPLLPISRDEFEELKKEVAELRELLKAAKKFDESTGQKDCQMDEKVAMIKKLAEIVGVDMTEIFG